MFSVLWNVVWIKCRNAQTGRNNELYLFITIIYFLFCEKRFCMYNWLEHSLFLYMCFFCNEQKTQLVDVSIMHNVKPIEWLHLYIQWQKISSSDEAVGYVGIFIVKHICPKIKFDSENWPHLPKLKTSWLNQITLSQRFGINVVHRFLLVFFRG